MTASKNNWRSTFRSWFWRTSLLYRTYWLCKLYFKTIANFFDNRGYYRYNLSLFPVSA